MDHAAILVSHGQPSDQEVGEAEIRALADQVGAFLPGWSVEGVTLASDGALDAACARQTHALVYPMFMADGWFTQTNLRRRLRAHRGAQLATFGTDPGLVALAARWLTSHGTDVSALVVTAHGSGRSPYAALDTQIFVDRLARLVQFKTVRTGFVEQAPLLLDALSGLGPDSLCLPFFAARRGHVLDDLPEAVAASGFAGRVLDPIGLHPDVPALIADTLKTHASQTGDLR